MRIATVPLYTNVFMLCIHVPLACLFVFTLDMDYLGAAYATILSSVVTYLFLLVLLSYRTDIEDAVFWPGVDSFRDWKNCLAIGVPIMIAGTVMMS